MHSLFLFINVTISGNVRIIKYKPINTNNMGYTHYWKGKKQSSKKFNTFVDTCKILYQNLPEKSDTAGGYYSDNLIEIAGGNGEGKPVFDSNLVCFNGKGDELSHETYFVENKTENNFCKTARKPYDLLVVACLIASYRILGYKIASDGIYWKENTCADLQQGIDYYNQIIKPDIPVTPLEIMENCFD